MPPARDVPYSEVAATERWAATGIAANPRALAFYERMGLREVAREGVKIRMRYTP